MILTIGMIVKNEAQNLERCLKSLTKLRAMVDSELIIVDTGSSDNTVEIAQRFATEVRRFVWCDDFAAARNASLKDAHGEWFMCIDADEFLENDSDLISFFVSGEYKGFNSATYIQRNYHSLRERDYSDFHAPRLTRLLPNTHYEGTIHESLNSYGKPIKHLESHVRHYGYYYETDEQRQKKAERNRLLLLEKLKRDPTDARVYKQLCDVTMSPTDDTALKYATTGIDCAIRAQNIPLSYVLEVSRITHLFLMCIESKNYLAKLKTTISNYFRRRVKDLSTPKIIASDIEVYAFKAMTCGLDKNPEGLIEAFEVYNPLFHEFKEGRHHTSDFYLASFSYLTKNLFPLSHATKAYIDLGQLDKALALMEEIPYSDFSNFPDLKPERLSCEFAYCNQVGNYDRLKVILQDEDTADTTLLSLLCYEAKQCKKPDELFRVLKECAYDERPVRIYYSYFNGDDAELRSQIQLYDTLPENLYDVIFMLLDHGQNLDILEDKIKLQNITEYYVGSKRRREYEALIIKYISSTELDGLSQYTLILIARLSEAIFAFSGENQGTSLFLSYADLYAQYFFKNGREPLLEHVDTFEQEHRFGYFARLAKYYFTHSQKSEFINLLKNALMASPAMKNIINSVLNLVYEFETPTELQALSNHIKQVIFTEYKNGDTDTALATMASFEGISPNDPEIEYLRSFIEKRNNHA